MVWQVNNTLVRLPDTLPCELSRVIGTLISDRLPTREASPWRKALAKHEQAGGPENGKPPENPWPVEAALCAYPARQICGRGEIILWELKLLGESADHGLFLQTLLPALEEASYTSDSRWNSPQRLWGRFDIRAVYVARGPRWEPLVSEGNLNLRYRPGADQWAEDLVFAPKTGRPLRRLHWLAPFDMPNAPGEEIAPDAAAGATHTRQAPGLHTILEALTARLHGLVPGRRGVPEEVWETLGDKDAADILKQAEAVPIQSSKLLPVPDPRPGRWEGTQSFDAIPDELHPYLQLASILHIGSHTHFGCGSFTLS